MLYTLIFLPLLLSAVSSSRLALRNLTVSCNNSPHLCSRSYSDITQLGAHDSPFLKSASTNTSVKSLGDDAGDQQSNSTIQLSLGARLLTAQVHKYNGTWHLCHSSCVLLDAGPLRSWLAEIKSWMDQNPNDVVTILLVNADNASATDLKGEYEASNIAPYGYVPPSTTTALASWPTLQDMIDNNTRLVTFVASLDPTPNTVAPYLLDEFTFVFENNYNVTSLTNFSCEADRPPPLQGKTMQAVKSGRLPLVNHFLYETLALGIEAPSYGNISITNGISGVGSLGEAQSSCTKVYGRKPAFLLVDFIDQGQALSIVDAANGINAVDRGPTISPAAPNSTLITHPSANSGHLLETFGKVFAANIALWTLCVMYQVL